MAVRNLSIRFIVAASTVKSHRSSFDTDASRKITAALLGLCRVPPLDVAKRAHCSEKTVTRFLSGAEVEDPRAILDAALDSLLGEHLLGLLGPRGRALFEVATPTWEAACSLALGRSTEEHSDRRDLHVLALDAGLRWAAYRSLCRAAAPDEALECALVGFARDGERHRRQIGDVLEHVVRSLMRRNGMLSMADMPQPTGYSRRALDGWLRGRVAITAAGLACLAKTLGGKSVRDDASAVHLSLRLSAAVQSAQLRSGYPDAAVRSALRLLVSCTRAAQAALDRHDWGRDELIAVVARGVASRLGSRLLRGASTQALDCRGALLTLALGGAPRTSIRRVDVLCPPSPNGHDELAFFPGDWALDDETDRDLLAAAVLLRLSLQPLSDVPSPLLQLARAGVIAGMYDGLLHLSDGERDLDPTRHAARCAQLAAEVVRSEPRSFAELLVHIAAVSQGKFAFLAQQPGESH